MMKSSTINPLYYPKSVITATVHVPLLALTALYSNFLILVASIDERITLVPYSLA